MPELKLRDLLLVKKALAIAALAIERQPGPLQPERDMVDIVNVHLKLTQDVHLKLTHL